MIRCLDYDIICVCIHVLISLSFFLSLCVCQDTGYEVEVETTFDQFTAHIASDPRSDTLDRGNIKLTFASVSNTHTHTHTHTHSLSCTCLL